MDDMKNIVERAFEEAIRAMVNEVIADKVGHGVDNDIQQLIKERARALLAENKELDELLMNAICSWINIQTADDMRRKHEEHRRRVG